MCDFDKDANITLTDEDGNDIEMRTLDTFDYDGSTYIALCDVDDADDAENADEEEVGVVLLCVTEEDGEKILEEIDDEKLLSDVFEVFIARAEARDDCDDE